VFPIFQEALDALRSSFSRLRPNHTPGAFASVRSSYLQYFVHYRINTGGIDMAAVADEVYTMELLKFNRRSVIANRLLNSVAHQTTDDMLAMDTGVADGGLVRHVFGAKRDLWEVFLTSSYVGGCLFSWWLFLLTGLILLVGLGTGRSWSLPLVFAPSDLISLAVLEPYGMTQRSGSRPVYTDRAMLSLAAELGSQAFGHFCPAIVTITMCLQLLTGRWDGMLVGLILMSGTFYRIWTYRARRTL